MLPNFIIGSPEDISQTRTERNVKNRRISYRRADTIENEDRIYGMTLLPFTEHGIKRINIFKAYGIKL